MGSCLYAESRSPRPGSPSSSLGFGGKKRKNTKKKTGSRHPSFDYRRDEPLHRIPGRLFLNGSSHIASLFTQQGKKGTNQDAMVVWEVDGSIDGVRYFQAKSEYFGSFVLTQNLSPSISFVQALYTRYKSESTNEKEDETDV